MEIPAAATTGSVGLDGRLPDQEDVILQPHQLTCVNTRIRVQPPKDIYTQVMLRSSFGSQGVFLASGGLIDTDYTGPIILCLLNLTEKPITIKRKQAFYQLVFHKRENLSLMIMDHKLNLLPTKRGTGNFGSTGF